MDLLAFFLWRSLICCDVRPEKKSGKILYTDTIAKLQAKDLWGPFFAQQRSSSIKAKKKWGQTGLRDLTHYNVARQNEHCKWVHSAV